MLSRANPRPSIATRETHAAWEARHDDKTLARMLVSVEGNARVPGNARPDNVLSGAVRARVRSALFTSIQAALGGGKEAAVAFTSQLEACAVAYSKNNYERYMSMMDRVTYNLKHNGRLVLSTYPVSRVCLLSHARLRAETSNALRDRDVSARLSKLMADAKGYADEATQLAESVHSLSVVRCPKCKGTSEINRFSEQTRSADEGMTTFFMCKCGYRWKQS